MVARGISKGGALLVLMVAAQGLGGCVLGDLARRYWGEAPVSQGVVDLASQASGPGCASPLEVLTASTDQKSLEVLECWEKTAREVFRAVRGEHEGRILASEIRYLISRRVISFTGDIERDQRRVEAVLGVAGFQDATLSAEGFQRWSGWVRTKRLQLRRSYALWVELPEVAPRRYEDFHALVHLGASALRQAGFRFSPEEMAHVWDGAVHPEDRDWRRALVPVARSLFEVASTLCPGLDAWDAAVMAGCLERATDGLAAAPRYVEWVLNPAPAANAADRFDSARAQVLEDELREAGRRFQDWFSQPGLGTIRTDHWVEMMNALGARLPDDILDRLGWIEKLKGRSTAGEIHPSAISRFFAVAGRAQVRIWRAIPVFQRLEREGRCGGADWKNCAYTGTAQPSLAPEAIRWALQIRNLKWGREAVPLTGRRLSQMAYFAELADEVLRAFDSDGDGVVQASPIEEEDEILDLMASVLQGIESWQALVGNLEAKWKGDVLKGGAPVVPISGLSLHGLARLLAMSSDVLVVRDSPEERNRLEEIFGLLVNLFPRSALFLDSKSLAASFTLALSLGDFSEAYQQELESVEELAVRLDPASRARFVHEDELRRALPSLLLRHFPRTAESCHRWGWQKSCERAFLQILPRSDDYPELIRVSDLDLLTIIATAVEGLVDSCDRDGDGELEGNLWSGSDELDCAVTRVKDGTLRLMESRVLKIERFWQRAGVEITLHAMNSLFVGRHFGKLSIVRGRPVVVPVWGIWRSGSVGSLYSLLGHLSRP